MIKYLLLSGGGIKGISLIGAIKALQDKGEYSYESAEGFLGGSVGSIVATLLCCGYTIDELYDIMLKINFHEYKDIDITRSLCEYGIDTGNKLSKLFKIIIKQKCDGNPVITFKELYEKTNKLLVITGTCLNTSETVYFDHIKYPDMIIADAMRISISIPGYYTSPVYEGNFYVDGIVSCVMPFEYLTEEQIKDSIGILIHESDNKNNAVESIEDYAIMLLRCIMNNMSNQVIKKYKDNLIMIIMNNVLAIDFDQTEEDKIAMFKSGYEASESYNKNIEVSAKDVMIQTKSSSDQ